MAAPDLPPVAGNSSNSRSSLTTRQHTRKPYERPADPSSSSSFAASETRSRGGSTLTATTKAEQRQPAGGRFGSGLTRFLSAPLGWIGLSSSSSSSGFKQQQPPASRSARQQQQPSLSNDELEQPSVNELLLPYSESSAAAPTSTVSTRYAPVGSVAGSSTSYYNDPPASSFRPGSTSSSRIPLTGNSSSRINGFVPSSARPYLLQQSQRSSPGLASSMRRSETTLGFPSSPSSALLPRATATSSASTVGAWQERYARRTDHGSASAGRGGMIERGPVLGHSVRSLPRAHSVAAFPTTERTTRALSVDSNDDGVDEPARKRSRATPSFVSGPFPTNGQQGQQQQQPRGQMVWSPTKGFLTQRTAAAAAQHREQQQEYQHQRGQLAPNAAERILQSLESMRAPAALSAVPPFLTAGGSGAGLGRSSSMGRIHVPTASSTKRSPFAPNSSKSGTADGSINGSFVGAMISPYGRERAERSRLAESRRAASSGLRSLLDGSRRCARTAVRDDEDELEVEQAEASDSEMENDELEEEERRVREGREREERRRRRRELKGKYKASEAEDVNRSSTAATNPVEPLASASPSAAPKPPSPPSPSTSGSPIPAPPAAPASKPSAKPFSALPSSNGQIDLGAPLSTDDSSFQAVAASSSAARSSLRARSSTTRRQHVPAAGGASSSRGSTPGLGAGAHSGRFSARDEDLNGDDGPESGQASSVEEADQPLPPPKKTVGPADFFAAPPTASKATTTSNGASRPQPAFSFGEGSILPPAAATPSKSAGANPAFDGSTTPAGPPPASSASGEQAAGKPPAFFASALSSSSDATAAPAKPVSNPFAGVGLPASTSSAGSPPVVPAGPSTIPNFFGKSAEAASTQAVLASNPFAGVGLSKPAPASPVAAAEPVKPATNPFAGVGVKEPTAAPALASASGGFSFGNSSVPKVIPSETSTAAAATQPFTFGATVTPDVPAASSSSSSTTSSNPFAFGAAAPAKQDKSTPPLAPPPAPAAPTSIGFSFGAPSATPALTTGNPFAGIGTSADKPATPAPLFGSAAPSLSSTPAPPASKPSFSFGAPSAAATAAAPKPFGALSSVAATDNGGSGMESSPERPAGPTSSGGPGPTPLSFTFGAPTPAAATEASKPTSSSFTFGASSSATPSASAAAPSKPSFSFGAPTPAAAPSNPFGNSSSTVSAPPSTNPFGSAPAAASAPAPSSAPAFSFGAGGGGSATFGSGVSTPAFGSSAPSPAFGQSTAAPAAANPFGSSTAPAFGEPKPATAAPAFTFGSGAASPAISSQANSGFTFGATPPASAGSGSAGFGGAAAPAFGSAAGAPTPAFVFGGSTSTANAPAFGAPTSSPFGGGGGGGGGFSGTTTPTTGTFQFGAPSAGGTATPPRFGSPAPAASSGNGPALFSMGAADSTASPARVGPNGRPIRPLASRRAGSKKL